MPKGIMCSCGCKSIITEVNPDTGKPFAKCEKSRKEYKKAESKRRNQQRKTNMNHARNGNGSLIYDTANWKTLSNKKRTVSPYCEECFEQGRGYVLADVVDHIVEIKDDPSLAYRWSNLKSLCHVCHNNKSAQEKKKRSGGMTDGEFEFV